MLLLSRNRGQSVIITLPGGQEIKVTVTEITRSWTTIGFEAAGDIQIWREEINDKIKEEANARSR